MIKLTNLDKPIVTLDNMPIADLKGKSSLTYKSALISTCEMHKPKNPGSGEALRAFDLGIRLLKSKDEIELEKEEIDFLITLTSDSSIFISLIIGRIIHYLKDTIDKKVDNSKNN